MNLPSLIAPPSTDVFNADKIAQTLQDRGFCILDDFLDLDATVLDNLCTIARDKVAAEACPTQQSTAIRRDVTCDIDPLQNLHGLMPGLESVCRLIQFYCCRELGRAMGLDLYCRERPQLAHYPGGSTFYCRHFDNPRFLEHTDNDDEMEGRDNKRRLTVIYYLNKDWVTTFMSSPTEVQEADGTGVNGQLKIYPSKSEGEVVYVEPIFNRVVIFLSDTIEHEVLPTINSRYALTIWLSIKDESNSTLGDGDTMQAYQEMFEQLSAMFYPNICGR